MLTACSRLHKTPNRDHKPKFKVIADIRSLTVAPHRKIAYDAGLGSDFRTCHQPQYL